MRKIGRMSLCLMLALLFVIAMGTNALAEHCKYGSEGSCDVIWWVDGQNRMHARACRNHVEDKEYGNYVLLTEWSKCTLDDGGECTVCGWDYERDTSWDPTDDERMEAYMLEYFMMAIESGKAPVDLKKNGNKMEVILSEYYKNLMDELGIPLSESMYVSTEYTLKLNGGSEYAYTGSAIKPEVSLVHSQYGPLEWLLKHELIAIGSVIYTNNVNPGTATASVTIKVKDSVSETLSVNFTITGENGDAGDEDADDDDDDDDKDNGKQDELVELLKGSVSLVGQIGANSELNVSAIDTGDAGYDKLSELAQKSNGEVIAAYEVALTGEIDGPLTLTFDVGDRYDGRTANIFHGLKNGGVESFTDVVEDGKVSVTVNELSPFVVSIQPAEEVIEVLPKTGDSSQMLLWMAMLLTSVLCLAAFGKAKAKSC